MISTSAILRHAVNMIFRDPGATFRVLAPALAVIGATVLLALLLAPNLLAKWLSPEADTPEFLPVDQIGLILLFALAAMIGFVLMAVLWHRYVLADDATRAAGVRPGAGVVGAYIWRSILLALILMVLAIPLMIVTGILIAATGGTLPVAMVLALAVAAIMAWVSLRLSLVLPATALEKRLSFGDSWRETAPASGNIFWLAIILAALNQLVTTLLNVLVPGPLFLSVALQLVATIIVTLISVSALTTLYGVLIEKRDID